MEELRRNLNKLEQERLYDSSSKEPRFDQKNEKMGMCQEIHALSIHVHNNIIHMEHNL